MNVHDVIRAVERTARQQHGVIHIDQLRAAGATRTIVSYRLRTKSWIRLSPTVYALASFPSSWQRQYKAAQLTTRESSIFGLAAAHVLGWDGFPTVRPEVVSSHTTNHRNRLAAVHRCDDFKTTVVDRIRVTTNAQTLCDVLTRVKLDRWERACDHLLLTGKMAFADSTNAVRRMSCHGALASTRFARWCANDQQRLGLRSRATLRSSCDRRSRSCHFVRGLYGRRRHHGETVSASTGSSLRGG